MHLRRGRRNRVLCWSRRRTSMPQLRDLGVAPTRAAANASTTGTAPWAIKRIFPTDPRSKVIYAHTKEKPKGPRAQRAERELRWPWGLRPRHVAVYGRVRLYAPSAHRPPEADQGDASVHRNGRARFAQSARWGSATTSATRRYGLRYDDLFMAYGVQRQVDLYSFQPGRARGGAIWPWRTSSRA
jgi:hypothetical protein